MASSAEATSTQTARGTADVGNGSDPQPQSDTLLASSVDIRQASALFLEKWLHLQAIVFERSFFLWVGETTPSFQHLNVAVLSSMDPLPSTTSLMGSGKYEDDYPSGLSQRLALKTGKMCVLSINLTFSHPLIEAFVEKQAIALIKGKQGATTSSAPATGAKNSSPTSPSS